MSCIELREAVLGDGGDTREIKLTGRDDISAFTTAHAHFWRGSGDPIKVPSTITSATTPVVVTVPLGTFLTDPLAAAATWLFQIVLDEGQSTQLTFPNEADRIAQLVVRASSG